MINISEDVIKELLQKEIKDQVSKYIKSKTFEQMIKQEIVTEFCQYKNLESISESVFMNNKCMRDNISKVVANKLFNIIQYSLQPQNEEYDDYDDF